MKQIISKRDQKIIKALEKDGITLGELADKYNLSRQRISQIFYKYTDHEPGWLQTKRRMLSALQKMHDLIQVKFECASCGKLVTYLEAGRKNKYCDECHKLSQEEKRDVMTTYQCVFCGEDYHPFRNKLYAEKNSKRSSRNFCSSSCYNSYRKGEKLEEKRER